MAAGFAIEDRVAQQGNGDEYERPPVSEGAAGSTVGGGYDIRG